VGAVQLPAYGAANQQPQVVGDVSRYGEGPGGEATFFQGLEGGGFAPIAQQVASGNAGIGYPRNWNPFNRPPLLSHVNNNPTSQ
jgi:hypothetical protein